METLNIKLGMINLGIIKDGIIKDGIIKDGIIVFKITVRIKITKTIVK